MVEKQTLADKILYTAIHLAEQKSWEALHMYQIADELGISLEELQKHYPDKEHIATAWFNRADKAMLQLASNPELHAFSPQQRFHILIMAWLNSLAEHRIVTRQMILKNLIPGHFFEQAQAWLHTRNTIDWMIEAAHGKAKDLKLSVETMGLTFIFITTLFYWLYDDSHHSQNTQKFLQKYLYQGKNTFNLFNKWIYQPYKNLTAKF